jgi:tripartite-type tricarboxylate transporter receptor subunit TctC
VPEFIKADTDPNFMSQLQKYGANPAAMNAEGFTKFLKDDIAFWKEAVSISGLQESVN